jgi:hypothetical protein
VRANDSTEARIDMTGDGKSTVNSVVVLGTAATAVTAPVSVTFGVIGVDDPIVDGTVPYAVEIFVVRSAPVVATASLASGTASHVLVMRNADDDRAAILLSTAANAAATVVTDERGRTATLSVTLAAAPATAITLLFSSDAATPEVEFAPVSLRFAAGERGPMAVAVIGVDDDLPDGMARHRITARVADADAAAGIPSPDPAYRGVNVSVDAINHDDELPGVQFAASCKRTTEGGGSCTLLVTPGIAVELPVTLAVASTHPAEATVSVSSVTLATSGDAIPVVVTGVNDVFADGDIDFAITFANEARGISEQFAMVNGDDDIAAALVLSSGACITSELGEKSEWRVVLTAAPLTSVTIRYRIEPATAPAALTGLDRGVITFDASNWDTPQPVTVIGLRDGAIGNGDATFLAVAQLEPGSDVRFGISGAVETTLERSCVSLDKRWPSIDTLTPSTVPPGSGFTLTITGSNFDVGRIGPVVRIGDVALRVITVGATTITASPIETVARVAGRHQPQHEQQDQQQQQQHHHQEGEKAQLYLADDGQLDLDLGLDLDHSDDNNAQQSDSRHRRRRLSALVANVASGTRISDLHGPVIVRVENPDGSYANVPDVVWVSPCLKGTRELDDGRCVPCDNREQDCPGGARWYAVSGSWQASNGEVVACRPVEACTGGENGTCAAGYTGDFCAQCDAGFYKEGLTCHSCGAASTVFYRLTGSAVSVLVIVALFLTAAILCRDETFTDLIDAVNALQLVQTVGRSNQPEISGFMASFYHNLSLIALDVSFLLPGCAGVSSSIAVFVGSIVLVIVVAIASAAVFKGIGRGHVKYLQRRGRHDDAA